MHEREKQQIIESEDKEKVQDIDYRAKMELKNRLLEQRGFYQVMKKWLATGRILKRAREEVGGFLE